MSNIDINNLMISGIVVRDPESKAFGNDGERKLLRTIVTISAKTFAMNASRFDIDIIFWGRNAEYLERSIRKGDFICASGLLRGIAPNSGKIEVLGKVLFSDETAVKGEEDTMVL